MMVTHALVAVLTGVIVMNFPVISQDGMRFDIRAVPAALVGMYAGPQAAVVVAIPLALYRVSLGGPVLAGVVNILLASIAGGLLYGGVSVVERPFSRVVWRSLLSFMIANCSLLLVGFTHFRDMIVPLTLAQIAGALASALVVRNRVHVLRKMKRLKGLAEQDGLTGVANRRHFVDLALRPVVDPTHLLLVDIDHFKHVNDTYGHAAGDKVLRKVVQIIRYSVGHQDVVGRLGGEEFGILLRGYSSNSALILAESIRTAVAAEDIAIGQNQFIKVTVSGGVVRVPYRNNPMNLMEHADKLLYQAKAAGRNLIVCSPAFKRQAE